jgi:2-polyprenyl-3-methyl-5-hydroxy-6-metoxy-1,4-benzoquinol methylase
MPSTLSINCPVCEQAELLHFQAIKQQQYLRCPECQCTVLAPDCRLNAEQEKAIYQYHDNNPGDPGYRRFLVKVADPLLARIPRGAHGLDFGCGPGPALAGMLEEAGMVVALYDPFFHPQPDVLKQQYDFITCTEVLEHLYQPAAVLRQLDGLLKPGGLLAVMTCFQTDDTRFASWHYRRDPTHVVFYKEETLGLIAKRHQWILEVPRKDVALFTKCGE